MSLDQDSLPQEDIATELREYAEGVTKTDEQRRSPQQSRRK